MMGIFTEIDGIQEASTFRQVFGITLRPITERKLNQIVSL